MDVSLHCLNIFEFCLILDETLVFEVHVYLTVYFLNVVCQKHCGKEKVPSGWFQRMV